MIPILLALIQSAFALQGSSPTPSPTPMPASACTATTTPTPLPRPAFDARVIVSFRQFVADWQRGLIPSLSGLAGLIAARNSYSIGAGLLALPADVTVQAAAATARCEFRIEVLEQGRDAVWDHGNAWPAGVERVKGLSAAQARIEPDCALYGRAHASLEFDPDSPEVFGAQAQVPRPSEDPFRPAGPVRSRVKVYFTVEHAGRRLMQESANPHVSIQVTTTPERAAAEGWGFVSGSGSLGLNYHRGGGVVAGRRDPGRLELGGSRLTPVEAAAGDTVTRRFPGEDQPLSTGWVRADETILTITAAVRVSASVCKLLDQTVSAFAQVTGAHGLRAAGRCEACGQGGDVDVDAALAATNGWTDRPEERR